MMLLLLILWSAAVYTSFLHAVVLTEGFFEANHSLIYEKGVDTIPAYGYSVLNGFVAMVFFPIYWGCAIDCHRHFHGDWVRWAEEAVRQKNVLKNKQ